MDVRLPIKLFVYGTLMTGFKYRYALEESRFLGRAKTKDTFSLYAREYPFVTSITSTDSDSRPTAIYGEVYEVIDQDVLLALDEIEGHPVEYVRKPVQVILEESRETVEAWIYFNDRESITGEDVEVILSGDFRDSKLAPHRLASGGEC
eukprot:gene8616-9495_t